MCGGKWLCTPGAEADGGDDDDDDDGGDFLMIPKMAYFRRRARIEGIGAPNGDVDAAADIFYEEQPETQPSRRCFTDEYERLTREVARSRQWCIAAALMETARRMQIQTIYVACRTSGNSVFAASASSADGGPAFVHCGAAAAPNPPLWIAGRRAVLVMAETWSESPVEVSADGRGPLVTM